MAMYIEVPDGSHMTHFYSGKEDAFGVSMPYLLEGIKRGEALLAVMPAERSRELLANLEQQRYPVENWLKSGRLQLSEGMDSPEEMIRYLASFTKKAGSIKIGGRRGLGHPKRLGFGSVQDFGGSRRLFAFEGRKALPLPVQP